MAEAVAFGVPHPGWGEEVAAAIVLKEGTDAAAGEASVMAFCKERLADFKRPKKIHIVEAIPRTATGKIQRRVVAVFAAQAQDIAVEGRADHIASRVKVQVKPPDASEMF